MRILFAGLQKECLRLGHLLSLADEHFLLPPAVMAPLLFPGLAVGDVLSGAYFLFKLTSFCDVLIRMWVACYFSREGSTSDRT